MTSQKRLKKEEEVEVLKEKVGKAAALVLADYHGLTTVQISELRHSLKEAGAELTVAKNTLLSRALKEKSFSNLNLEEFLKGPTAVIFSYDDFILAIKILVGFIKKNTLLKIKIGIKDKGLLTENVITQIYLLPTKEVLLGRVVGNLKSPLYGLVNSLSWNLKMLVYVLEQIRSREGGDNYGRR